MRLAAPNYDKFETAAAWAAAHRSAGYGAADPLLEPSASDATVAAYVEDVYFSADLAASLGI